MVPIDFDSVDVKRVEAENIDVFAFKKVGVHVGVGVGDFKFYK